MPTETVQQEAQQEEKVTELMDVERRDAMRAQGWRIVRIDSRQITWRRDSQEVQA